MNPGLCLAKLSFAVLVTLSSWASLEAQQQPTFLIPVETKGGWLRDSVAVARRQNGVVIGPLFLVLISSAAHASQRTNPNVSEEEKLFIEIMKKAMDEPLSNTELSSLKYVLKNYNSKTNLSFTKQDVEAMVKMTLEGSRYNYELGQCVLNSLDQKRPIVSEELRRLRDQMQRNGTRKSKLDADFAKIISAANGTTWMDEAGRMHAPLQRADVLAGLATLKVATANMEKITRIVNELSEGK